MESNWGLRTVVAGEAAIVEVLLGQEDDKFMCQDCGNEFSSHYELLRHDKDNHDKVEEKIMLWWRDVGGGPKLSHQAFSYFRDAFTLPADDVMLNFSCDGVNLIPSIFSGLERADSLNKVRMMFDRYIHRKTVPTPAEVLITPDEKHILQYIGGFILNRMLKKCKEDDCIVLQQLIDPEAASEDSLIKVLEESRFGSLTVPSSKTTDFLLEVEKVFRKHYTSTNLAKTVISKFNCDKITTIFMVDDKMLNILSKLIVYFIKIRCHQKATTLKTKFQLKSDQNISTRKKLKSK